MKITKRVKAAKEKLNNSTGLDRWDKCWHRARIARLDRMRKAKYSK